MGSMNKTAIVAGVSINGLGEAICQQLIDRGYRVAGIGRTNKHEVLLKSLGKTSYLPVTCDLAVASEVDQAVAQVEQRFGPACVYVHNAARLHMQPFLETDPDEYESLWKTICLGAVNGSQRVLPAMLENKHGTLLFIGATASVKAGATFSAFSSAKFALRGLSQSLARELGPRGIHVIHPVIDGVIWGERARSVFKMSEHQCINPEHIAKTCLQLIEQDSSAWTHEIDIRPSVEHF